MLIIVIDIMLLSSSTVTIHSYICKLMILVLMNNDDIVVPGQLETSSDSFGGEMLVSSADHSRYPGEVQERVF